MGIIDLLRTRKREKDELKPSERIVLNPIEEEFFKRLSHTEAPLEKEFIVKRESRDKTLPEAKCFRINNEKKLCSISELREFASSLSDEEFQKNKSEIMLGLKRWVANVLQLPVLAEQLETAPSKQEFIAALDSFLQPVLSVEEKPIDYSKFNLELEGCVNRLNKIKERVREARKQGVNTFFSQTLLLNIKPKLDYAVLNKDSSALAQISARLEQVEQELEEEIKAKKEDDANGNPE